MFGVEHFDYYFDAGAIKGKKGDILEVTVEGLADTDATIASISLMDTSKQDWQDWKYFGGEWGLRTKLKQGEPFRKTVRIKLEDTTNKKTPPQVRIELTKADKSILTIDNLKASWRPAPDVPKELTVGVYEDEWGKRFGFQIPIKNLEMKKGQKLQITFSGKTDLDCDFGAWLANLNNWSCPNGEPEIDNPEDQRITKGLKFTKSGRLPIIEDISKKEPYGLNFWIPWEEGMPDEINITDIEFTWKIIK